MRVNNRDGGAAWVDICACVQIRAGISSRSIFGLIPKSVAPGLVKLDGEQKSADAAIIHTHTHIRTHMCDINYYRIFLKNYYNIIELL